MDNPADLTIEERRQFVDAWNETMIDMWQTQIARYKVIDTGALYNSPILTRYDADGRILSIDIAFSFLEYGVWQKFGTGREFSTQNPANSPGDVACLGEEYREKHHLNEPRKRGPRWGGGYTSGFPRIPRDWFSSKYYRSVMAMKEFMAYSVGEEFKGLCAGLDDRDYRNSALHRRASSARR